MEDIIDDKFILDYFYRGKPWIKRNHLREHDEKITEYLKNRFDDIDENTTEFEIIFRIKYNIENRPTCHVCGKPVEFVGKPSLKYRTYCSLSCLSKDTANKVEQKYGVRSTLRLDDIQEKSKFTLLEKYGVDHNWKVKEIHDKTVQKTSELYDRKDLVEKSKQTKLERYGDANYNNYEKAKETWLEHYGVDHPLKIKEIIENAQQKRQITLKKNGTYNTSKIEENLADYLNKHNIKFERQYTSKSYPFNCDFYLNDYDLYIEIQGTWLHGVHPYTGNDEDISKLNEWKKLSKEHSFYENAIYTWTDLDVRKRETAKENKLNYLEIFSINLETCIKEICDWLVLHGHDDFRKKMANKHRKETFFERYGHECVFVNDKIKEKCKQTLLKNYGVDNPLKSDIIKQRVIQTNINRYSVDYPAKSDSVKQTMFKTNMDRYGSICTLNNKVIKEKARKTLLENYGVEHPLQSKKILEQSYITKKKHSTFNTSKIEENLADYLNKHNIRFERQYTSKVYPFACDFYLNDYDLYIEIQGTWTHGGHPYTGNDKDLETIKLWESKNTEYYKGAINTWTVSDVKKRETAKKNNLNYLEIFSFDFDACVKEINNWIELNSK